MTDRRLATIVVIATAFTWGVARAHTTPQAPSPAPAPPASQAPATPAPPPADTIYQPNVDRIAPPRVLTEVKPAYTPDAMRNRIQGRVRLQGVVERDGTISGITVVQSLDTQFGLDQAAVDALKQWRFQPGTLADGTPVRVLVNVELTFVLRDEAPVRAWPEGFSDATPAADAVEEAAETQGLRLAVRRPVDWTFRTTGPPSEWAGLRSADGLQLIAVLRPEAVPFELRNPSGNFEMARVADLVARLQPPGTAETLTVGQVESATSGFWVWSALRLRTVPNPPGTTTETNPYGGARAWAFARTIDGKIVVIQCTLLLPRELDSPALAARVPRAAAEFAAIVGSVRIDAVK